MKKLKQFSLSIPQMQQTKGGTFCVIIHQLSNGNAMPTGADNHANENAGGNNNENGNN